MFKDQDSSKFTVGQDNVEYGNSEKWNHSDSRDDNTQRVT